METSTKTFHQHAACLKHHGFTKIDEAKGPNPANPRRTSVLTSQWSKEEIGVIRIDHLQHTFLHEGTMELWPTGKDNARLEEYLLEAASKRQEASDSKKTAKGKATKKSPKKAKAKKSAAPKLAPEAEPVTALAEAA